MRRYLGMPSPRQIGPPVPVKTITRVPPPEPIKIITLVPPPTPRKIPPGRLGVYLPYSPMPYPLQLQWVNGQLVPAPPLVFGATPAPPSHMAGPRGGCKCHGKCGGRKARIRGRRGLGDDFSSPPFDPGSLPPPSSSECSSDSDCGPNGVCGAGVCYTETPGITPPTPTVGGTYVRSDGCTYDIATGNMISCPPGNNPGPGFPRPPGTSGGNNSVASLINALAQVAGRLIAGSGGITPSQFALQNPAQAQAAIARCQQTYGSGNPLALQCLQQQGYIAPAAASSGFSLSSIPWWGYAIGVVALVGFTRSSG